MVSKFEAVMSRLAVVGHNPNTLIDCSEVIPTPVTAKVNAASFPAGKSRKDVQAAVSWLIPFIQTPILTLLTVRCNPIPRSLHCTRYVNLTLILVSYLPYP